MITAESPDDLVSQAEGFFQQSRELRRRGRTLDEFAAKLSDQELKSAIQTLCGKLILAELVERSAIRPDVDGLQLWFDAHFEETQKDCNSGTGPVANRWHSRGSRTTGRAAFEDGFLNYDSGLGHKSPCNADSSPITFSPHAFLMPVTCGLSARGTH